MVGPRHAAAVAAFTLVLSLPVASCVAVVGANEDERKSAVEALCVCLVQAELMSGQKSCEGIVGDRLSKATDETRKTWMEEFIRMRCDRCVGDNAIKCYQTKPTCTEDKCKQAAECCPGMTCDDTLGLCVRSNP